MKRALLFISFAFLFLPMISWGQTIYYSQQSGDPAVYANWNTGRTGGGTSPSNFTTNSRYYVIQNGHTMTTTSVWSISGGSSVKLQIESGGILKSDYAVDLTSTGTFQIDSGGTYIHNNSGAANTTIFDGTEIFNSSSNVQINNWQGISNSLITGVTLPFGNLIIDWTSNTGDWQWGLSTGSINLCAGNFDIYSTGSGTTRLASSGSPTIAVSGDFSISNGTIDFSSGTGNSVLNLSGNFNMSGGSLTETSSGSGTIVFLGSSSQIYTKSSGTISNTVNFTINNSNGVILNNDLSINGPATLAMTSGNINLNGNTLTIGEDKTSTKIGNLNWISGFIVGSGLLKRWIQNSATISIGDVACLFPFGNSNNKNRNVWIGCITTSSGGGTIAIQHSDQTGYTDITAFTDGGILVNRRHNMSWSISAGDGLSGSSNFSVRIQCSGIPDGNVVSDLRLIRASDAVGTSQDGTGTTSDPQINRTGLTSANLSNTFYIGANSSVNPLPVELTAFTVSTSNHKVNLYWATSTEVNNYGFDIERRMGNESWMKIGFIEGSGNSDSPKSYSFTDEPKGGKEFEYRLRQIDIDGTYEYSDVVTVQLENVNTFVLDQNYPNPCNPSTRISYTLPEKAGVRLKVYDMLAKEVVELVNSYQEAGRYEVTFDGSNLSSGTYFYKLEAGNYVEVKKLVLIK